MNSRRPGCPDDRPSPRPQPVGFHQTPRTAVSLAPFVYGVVRLVPPGTVVTYGDLADLFDVSPRLVGRVMGLAGEPDVPWWRVVSASGTLPPELLARAREHWAVEGTPVRAEHARGGGGAAVAGVNLKRAHADLPELGRRAESALGQLPGRTEPPQP